MIDLRFSPILLLLGITKASLLAANNCLHGVPRDRLQPGDYLPRLAHTAERETVAALGEGQAVNECGRGACTARATLWVNLMQRLATPAPFSALSSTDQQWFWRTCTQACVKMGASGVSMQGVSCWSKTEAEDVRDNEELDQMRGMV